MKPDQKISFQIKAIPNSSKNVLVEYKDDVLKMKIAAPADKQKANQELIHFLSQIFKIPKTHIKITSGINSRMKRVSLEGLDLEKAKTLILEFQTKKANKRERKR